MIIVKMINITIMPDRWGGAGLEGLGVGRLGFSISCNTLGSEFFLECGKLEAHSQQSERDAHKAQFGEKVEILNIAQSR